MPNTTPEQDVINDKNAAICNAVASDHTQRDIAAAMRTLEDDSPDPYQPAIDALYAAQRAHGMTPAQLRGDR